MRKFISAAAIVVVAIAISSCGGGSSGGGGDTGTAMAGKATCTAATGENLLCGTAVAADGVTPLAGAEVRITSGATSAGASISTKGVENSTNCYADDTGNFVCVVPNTGSYTFVLIKTGFDNTSFSTTIAAGENNVGAQTMAANADVKWAVVPGTFDGVQVLLSEIKGCTLTDATGDPASARASEECTTAGLLVLDPTDTSSDTYVETFLLGSSLADYNSLFINCDANSIDYSDPAALNAAVTNFVNAGGHVYFSDLADDWFTASFPGQVTFLGEDTTTGTLSSEVVDTNLAAVVGNPINIEFDLPVWAAIDTLDAAGGTVYIQGDLSSVSTTYTGTHPITVGFRPSSTSGCVFYTSYHVEGAATGAPQELAIKYLVENIGTVCQ